MVLLSIYRDIPHSFLCAVVEIGLQKMQNVSSHNCWSLGSNEYSSRGLRKVSIGLTVDKCPKMISEVKENAAALPSGKNTSSHQGALETTRKGLEQTLKGKQSETLDQKASAWFSTKSVCCETQNADIVQFYVNRSSVLHSEAGVKKALNTVAYGKRMEKGRDVERVEEVAYASAQEANVLDKGTVKEEPEKTARCNSEGLRMKLMEVLDTAPSQKIHVTDSSNLKENKEHINNERHRENQKVKLDPSDKKQPNHEEARDNIKIGGSRKTQKCKIIERLGTTLNSPNLEENKEKKSRNQSSKYHNGKVFRHKQDSDTIETDSGSPNQVVRGPITRSSRKKAPPKIADKLPITRSSRKKAPPKIADKLQENNKYDKNPLAFPSSDFKFKLEKKNTFSFDEVEEKSGSFSRTASGHSNRSQKKIDEQKKAKIEPRKIVFPGFVSDQSLLHNDTAHKLLSPDNASEYSKGKVGSRSLPSKRKKDFTLDDLQNDSHHPQKEVQNHFGRPQVSYNAEPFENTDNPLSKKAKSYVENETNPPVPENNYLHKKDACSSMLREADQVNDGQSPTLAMNMHSTSPSNEVPCGAQPIKFTRKRKIYGSKDFDSPSSGSWQSDTNTESTDATTDIHKPQIMESQHTEEETEKQWSLSPTRRQNTKINIDDHKGKGRAKVDKLFSNDKSPQRKPSKYKSPKNSPVKHRHTRRASGLNKTKKTHPPSACPIGTAETVGSPEASGQNPEDCLASSVAQLASVLRNFKAKLKAQTFKESTKVLSTAADKIRLQLQGVESHILEDVEKFVSVGNSKRKRLESEFQEQQERLQLIHDKFKEEINQHLVDCRRTLEKLEACHVELKETVDQQKVSHGKLLMQVKQAVETDITDAETKIAAIQKEANKKMNGLKHMLGE